MARDFTITNDPSWTSGSVDGNVIYKPIIQNVNNVPSLKNTGISYIIFTGDKKL